MKLIRFLIRSLTTLEPRVLGRWQLETSLSTIHHKVDLANEDHCGICSEYRYSKVNEINIEKNDDSDEYIKYMM